MSNFNNAVSQTPKSTSFKRVIPWDSSSGDFVYGAVQDPCFRKKYNRKSLKHKIDREMDPDDWDPVSGYNTCFLVTIILIALTLIGTGILVFIFWDNFLQNWYWWLLVFVVLLITFIVVLCIFRSMSNKKVTRRQAQLEEVCTYINKTYLDGSGTGVFPGQAGAWLEVDLDPRKTKIEGSIIKDEGEGTKSQKIDVNPDKKSSSKRDEKYRDEEMNESMHELNLKEDKKSSSLKNPERKERKVRGGTGLSDLNESGDEVQSKKSVRFEDESSPGKSKYDSIKSKKSSRRGSTSDSVSKMDSRKVSMKEKVTEKKTQFVEINYSQTTPKKKGFYERFKKHKESGKKNSGEGGIRVKYDSEVPQQRVISDFVPTMNLMQNIESDKSEFDD